MQVLRSRLLALREEEAAKERGDLRSGMVGSGDRSEKIRTYNFPQDRVTDHRISQNFSNLPKIMEGHFSEIVEKLAEAEIAEKLKAE
jgi:peptide chain release factor 1